MTGERLSVSPSISSRYLLPGRRAEAFQNIREHLTPLNGERSHDGGSLADERLRARSMSMVSRLGPGLEGDAQAFLGDSHAAVARLSP